MDYLLENLGPERFQELCQSLLLKEFPDVQCFPVSQPDGGRDAISYIPESQPSQFVMFQVKFARRPHAEAEPHKWLLAVMQHEAPKIAHLLPQGATKYYLMTNIPGTGHLEVGALDRLNQTMSSELGIPFMCWWRDDITRRLDDSWALKWVYPEVMTGPDVLRAIVESGLSEERERRTAAFRAFMVHQLKQDEEVKFKQVELQNDLLDLFIDVPITVRDHHLSRLRLFNTVIAPLPKSYGDIDEFTEHVPFAEQLVTAATLLLSRRFQEIMPKVVIEGAPGQGKSTIAQYVCQVHRLKLLNDPALERLPSQHRINLSTRLPIKVDLRDFATWLSRRNPFAIEEQAEPSGWKKTLEAFLAALIAAHSGGTTFTTDDLIAICRLSALIIVFDGLDEVADLKQREEVVSELSKGIVRLNANSASLQVIVTSRPAAFAKSPGMSQREFAYLQLTSLTRPLIDEYADRWLRARRVQEKEAKEYRGILTDKLSQPHLRDLSRNPMQLAILLSLLHTRGSSLPDKRTALYDLYIELFLNRESEKSAIVREHRVLLVEIHQYLAWLLHSEAEGGNARASISLERLKDTVVKYLETEGQNPALSDALFSGVVERVVALVSRVEGTFEFEVQPLREYFAARFLYDTAPYSPPGRERSGTKPDRFDAVARNFFWTNVARFYAGCFSKGELPALVERLNALNVDDEFKYTNHPRSLSAMLLSDWVFSQSVHSAKAISDMILDDNGLRIFLASNAGSSRHRSSLGAFVLPPKNGREELISKCFTILRQDGISDFSVETTALLKSNEAFPGELTDRWLAEYASSGASRARWLQLGVDLGVLSHASTETLERIVRVAQSLQLVIRPLFLARRLDFLEANEERFEAVVSALLAGKVSARPMRKVESALDAMAHAIWTSRYSVIFHQKSPASLAQLTSSRRSHPESLLLPDDLATTTEAFRSHSICVHFAGIAEAEAARSAAEWASEIGPWNRLVEEGRKLWGDAWALVQLAVISGGIVSGERCKDTPDLLDHLRPLCSRIRHGRLRPGQREWWRRQFLGVKTLADAQLVCVAAITWASVATLMSLQEIVDATVKNLDAAAWAQLRNAVSRARFALGLDKKAARFDVNALSNDMSVRAAAVFTWRAGGETKRRIALRFRDAAIKGDPELRDTVLYNAVDARRFGLKSWRPDLATIRECYEAGAFFRTMPFESSARRRRQFRWPILASILKEPSRYPSTLISAAEEAYRLVAAERMKPVARVAGEEGWFDR